MGELIQLSSFKTKHTEPKHAPKKKPVTKREVMKISYDEVMVAQINTMLLLTSREGKQYLRSSAVIVDDAPYVKHDTNIWICWNTHIEVAKAFRKYVALYLGETVELELLCKMTYEETVELLDLLLRGRAMVRVIKEGRTSYQKVYILEPSPHYTPIEAFTDKWEALKSSTRQPSDIDQPTVILSPKP